MNRRIRKLSEVRKPTPAELRSCRLQLELLQDTLRELRDTLHTLRELRDTLRELLEAAGRPDQRERISAKLETVEKQLEVIASYWPGE